MQFKNKIFNVVALCALACGGQADEGVKYERVVTGSDGLTYSEVSGDAPLLDEEPDGATVSDFHGLPETVPATPQVDDDENFYGTARQPLKFLSLYGVKGGANAGRNPCVFPNDVNTPCRIPPDKTIFIGWQTGTITVNPVMPDIDWDVHLRAVVANLRTMNTGWSITYSQGHGEIVLLSSNTQGSLATTTIDAAQTQVFKAGDSDNPEGWYRYTDNACVIRLNAGVAAASWAGKTLADRSARAMRLIEHEIGHCIGFSDFDFSGSPSFLMYAFENPTPSHLTAAELNVLRFYQP